MENQYNSDVEYWQLNASAESQTSFRSFTLRYSCSIAGCAQWVSIFHAFCPSDFTFSRKNDKKVLFKARGPGFGNALLSGANKGAEQNCSQLEEAGPCSVRRGRSTACIASAVVLCVSVCVCVCVLFPSSSILEASLLADEADIGRKMLETIVKFDLTDLRLQSRFTTIDQLTQDALLRLDISLWPHTCRLIKLWMRLFPEHFRAPDLDEAIEQLKQQMIKIAPTRVKDHFPDLAKLTPYPWSRYSSIKQPLTERISLSFDQWTPENLAVNLTHIEYKLLRRISFEEYKEYATNSQLNAVPALQKSIASFNSISQWVQCMVLSKPLPRERAEVVTKFVNVAKHLKELKNFNTLMAVIGGLTHSSLARLCRTMACVPHETRLELSGFSNLLSSASNFSVYRKVLHMSHGFRIPIIGVHMKDLISLHTAIPDYSPEKMINCQKFSQLACIFTNLILDIQQPHLLSNANENLINTLRVALNIPYNDEEIYFLSLKREPKTLLQVRSSIQPAPVLADWAEGVQNRVEPSVMQKHVNTMVDAVFKHYDLNQDGYISKKEFDLIRSNFPLIDAFNALDVDHDGRISKQEMKLYFLRFRRNNRIDSRHRFREVNILTPTFCYQCKKLVWNILRQELKCEECGIIVHRNCREYLLSSCFRRRNTEPASRHRAFTEPPGSTNSAPSQNSVDDATVSRGNLFSLKRSKRRGAQATATSSTHANLTVDTTADSKVRSFSEGGPNYINMDSMCESIATLASEEVFETDEACEYDKNVKNS
ncbi:Ras guanyl-releasing protein 3 [Trichinella zimbabwensis]|uniref:Ras guanyl-releasing protein 3 n=1 Tax=Trichinella zimbabwensis TaxID=268475 RepID=A0A0V1HXA3_9BILA|nr:Ras guanyl-releasing protein 3 [Trichinella zimbabwensis]